LIDRGEFFVVERRDVDVRDIGNEAWCDG
jgi:hypothetical protein